MLEGAQSVVEYVMQVLTRERDLDDAKVKADIARQVLPLIEDVVDPWERETYRQNLARRLKVDERALLSMQPRRERRKRGRTAQVDPAQDNESRMVSGAAPSVLDGFCLGLLLRDPELMYHVDRALQSIELDKLAATDFQGSERQAVFRAVREALEQQDEEPVLHWRRNLVEPLQELAANLEQQVEAIDLNRPRVLDEVLADFLRLRKYNLEIGLSQLRFQLQAAQEAEDEQRLMDRPGIESYTQKAQNLALKLARVERAINQRQGTRQSSLASGGR